MRLRTGKLVSSAEILHVALMLLLDINKSGYLYKQNVMINSNNFIHCSLPYKTCKLHFLRNSDIAENLKY